MVVSTNKVVWLAQPPQCIRVPWGCCVYELSLGFGLSVLAYRGGLACMNYSWNLSVCVRILWGSMYVLECRGRCSSPGGVRSWSYVGSCCVAQVFLGTIAKHSVEKCSENYVIQNRMQDCCSVVFRSVPEIMYCDLCVFRLNDILSEE